MHHNNAACLLPSLHVSCLVCCHISGPLIRAHYWWGTVRVISGLITTFLIDTQAAVGMDAAGFLAFHLKEAIE